MPVDSLIYPDLVITTVLTLILMILVLYLVSGLVQLSINDYYASLSTYTFYECMNNGLKPMNLTHAYVVRGFLPNYLILCPVIRYDDDNHSLNVTIYTVVPR
ncbi:hypothetical protein [Vulcanisaeta thermophila]|uniref:hypothetical protein n=1 Tax=Vulcanisaeta thermophila TaxID=867917 RepID=UPI0008538E91|nr:hypothetical protein [Vulcanisaeta thermophila]